MLPWPNPRKKTETLVRMVLDPLGKHLDTASGYGIIVAPFDPNLPKPPAQVQQNRAKAPDLWHFWQPPPASPPPLRLRQPSATPVLLPVLLPVPLPVQAHVPATKPTAQDMSHRACPNQPARERGH